MLKIISTRISFLIHFNSPIHSVQSSLSRKNNEIPNHFIHRCINYLFDRTKPVVFRTSYDVKRETFFILSQTFLIIKSISYDTCILVLTLILLTWRIWWAPNNASKWQMGFKSALERLIFPLKIEIRFGRTVEMIYQAWFRFTQLFSRNQWWIREKYNNKLD